MIRFSICGAASYACGELLRLMVHHPETQVAHLADSFAAGRKIQDEHAALMGFYDQEILSLNDETLDMIVKDSDVVDCFQYGLPFARPEQERRYQSWLATRPGERDER